MFRSRVRRACVLAVLPVVLAAGCGDDEDDASPSTTTTTTTTSASSESATASSTTTTTEAVQTIEVTYAGGQVAGGAQRHEVAIGEKVRIRVTSDVADEVHVHTYDVIAPVAPGQVAQLELTASIPGQHEVELEGERRALLVLVVQ